VPITELLGRIEYLPQEDRDSIRRAYDVAERAHNGQARLTGEPYIEHPLAVAGILADLRLDPETLMAALLHDTVEDTAVTREEVRGLFGDQVAKLVDGVTKLGKIHVRSAEEHQAENIRKMLVAMAEDVRVVLIKLGDRLHNMRTVSAHTTERRLRISRETLDIYAPLAHRLGIWEIKGELEDLAFVQLDPDNYHLIEARLASSREQRDGFVRDVTEILGREFAPLGMHAEIAGRTKHTYSIHEKMVRGQKEFGEIYDIIAIRVLVDSIKDC
jgi:GTP diphosphokinase / guanosine-3',5'-bis(diphosphate) 3'-diphosphatase